MTSLYSWSLTAGSNGNSDSAIAWPEGQTPGSVNNSARAVMGRVAEFRDDIAGAVTATGTANGIVVAANSAFASLANGRIIAFRAAYDNTTATNLNVNSLGAKSVRKMGLAGDIPLTGGEIQAGGVYVCMYGTALNSSAGGWQLINPSLGTGAFIDLAEIDPRTFGVTMDSASDQSSAMQACLDYSEANGYLPIRIPLGRVTLAAQLTYDGPLTLRGVSMRESELYWTAAASTRGLDVDLSSSGGLRHTCQISSMSFLTASGGTGTAIDILDATPADRVNPSVIVRDVLISGATNPNSDGWSIGINMNGCQGAYVDGAHIWGKVASGGEPNYDSEYGIYYANGISASPHPTECHVVNSTIKTVEVGIHADDMEGLIVANSQIIGVNDGVQAVGLSDFPHVGIVNTHVNASERCIAIDRMFEVIVSSCLLYNQNSTAAAKGIELDNGASFFNITGNVYENLNAAYAGTGIDVVDGTKGFIGSNVFRRCDSTDTTAAGTGVKLQASSTSVTVGTNLYELTTTKISDAGTTNNIARERLTADRVYYVRTDGSNSNTGLANTAGAAFLTIQKAVDTVAKLDTAGFIVTIDIGDGTYTEGVELKNVLGATEPGGLIILGNSGTPSSVVVSSTSEDAFRAYFLNSSWDIRSLRVQTTTSGNGINAQGSKIRFTDVDFGVCAQAQMSASSGGSIEAIASYRITGNAATHITAVGCSSVVISGRTIVISGTPAYSFAFAYAYGGAVLEAMSMTFLGSATGVYYTVTNNGTIMTNGGGGTYFPGNSAGSDATGGIYS